MYQVTFNNNKTIEADVQEGHALIADKSFPFDIQKQADGGYSIITGDQKSYQLYLTELDLKGKTAKVSINNHHYDISVKEPIDLLLSKMGINMAAHRKAESIKAPMPGLILKIMVEEGQSIKKGDPVLILEAMKMENVFKAPADATVKLIRIQQGMAVEKGAVLIELE
ncbi:MAG: biotin/lipoyl-binding protein [Taibaiella sp.]|nr:biotin/lipoyl-binding protein [Taibaiella sp.]